MKNALRLLALTALATVFALPAYAQDAAAAPAAAAPTGPCTEADAKAAVYKRFTDNFKGTPDQQKTAYESGREYLSKYGSCEAAGDKQIATYVQNWVGKYEKAVVEFNCTKAANENPSQAFEACRPLIAANPDNVKFHLALVGAGIKSNASGSKNLNAQAAAEARTALRLIEQGKTADTWAPFANQQDTTMGLRYYIAAWTYDSAPEGAVAELLKVAQSSSIFAKEPATFQLLGAAYYNGELKKLADEYKAKYEGKEETPESKALFDRINVVLDRVIDAYARAVALSNANPSKYGATTTALRPVLTNLYKQRHENSEAGLNELIASVLSKPLPLPGQEPAPTASPASSSGTNGTNGASPATAQPAAGATAKPASSTTNTTPAAKPAATTQRPPRF
ncbi:MAG TPA: hypothetical protein VF611_20350 [Pyrinomonadaceae bacterium]